MQNLPDIVIAHLWSDATPHSAKANTAPSASVPYVVITSGVMGLSIGGVIVAFDIVAYCR